MQRVSYRTELLYWKHITAAAGVCICLCLSAARCSASTVYKNAMYSYRFEQPAGWEQKMDMPHQTAAFLGPIDNDFTSNLTVTVYTSRVESGDLQKFVRGINIEHGVISERKPCKLGGLSAYAWRTKLTIPGHPAAENRQVVCIYNHRAYELALTCAVGLMRPKYDAIFEKWVASFGWLSPSGAARQPTP